MGTLVRVRTKKGATPEKGPQGEGSQRKEEKRMWGKDATGLCGQRGKWAATLQSASLRGDSPAPDTLVTQRC